MYNILKNLYAEIDDKIEKGDVIIRDDKDERGIYIYKWENMPVLPVFLEDSNKLVLKEDRTFYDFYENIPNKNGMFDPDLILTSKQQEAQILQQQINEALAYLSSTDKKVLPYYDFEEGDDSLEHYIEARRIARQFVRDNQNA